MILTRVLARPELHKSTLSFRVGKRMTEVLAFEKISKANLVLFKKNIYGTQCASYFPGVKNVLQSVTLLSYLKK